MKRLSTLGFFVFVLVITGCSSAGGGKVDQSARLVGRENDVRIDALIRNLNVSAGSNVSISYEVENLRPHSIAIADLVPEVVFDSASGIITIHLGSEVPGNEFLPRLELVRSGERRSFTTGANLNVRARTQNAPLALRIRLTYLKDVEPFESLVGITQKTVHDPALADEMFLPWVEAVQYVDTNDIPLVRNVRPADDLSSTPRRSPRRPRPPGGW